jgi:hypothetical protein
VTKDNSQEWREAPLTRNAVAIPVGETAALVTMQFGPRGPWTVLTDMPSTGRELIGPPPGHLALAGWGC